MVDLDAFVTEHGREWNRLQVLVGRPRRKLTADQIDEMVVLYRRTATHLSVVQSRSPDPTLVAWLSRLVLQARAAITPSTGVSWTAIGRFFTVSFPVEVYRAARWWVSAGAGFVLLSAVLIAIVAADPTRFMSQDEINQMVNTSFEAYYSSSPPQNFAFAVWTNNAFLAAISLAGGVLLVPALLVLWTTGLNLGLIGGAMVANGRADVFFGLILVHGLLELTCIFIAAGVGMRIGWAWIAPGPLRTRTQAVAEAGRSGMVVALGLVVPLLVSGGVEAFVTPMPLPAVIKVGFGALVWLVFLGYVVILGTMAARRAETGDVAASERETFAPSV
jgi:uncharacterized membrane protein SpoIIM required for sporulation